MNRSLLKTKLITNSLLELGLEEDEGKGKGRYFVSKFIEAGLAHYKELGDILITKETLDKFIQTMVGCPVIIDHEDVNDKNVDKLRVGVISRVWYNEADGWYYCEGILTDNEAIDLVKNKGWSVSCSYSFVSDDTQKTYHGKPIDMEFTDGEFLHLAIVETPRYEGANIVVNKKDDDVEWITVKGNHIPVKKGQSKDEAVEEFLKDKQDSKGKEEKDEKKESGYGWDAYAVETQGGPAEYFYENPQQYERAVFKWAKPEATQGAHMEPPKAEHYSSQDDFIRDVSEWLKRGNPSKLKENIRKQYLKELDKNSEYKNYSQFYKNANNSIDKENIIMSVMDDLKDFILGVVNNEKEDEMKVKNEDKRKLIDEIGGILKDKVDEELWRTVEGKLEKIAYEPSEDDKTDNKKAKNEDDDKEKTENKCKNEDEKDKKVEDKDDKEEDPTKNEEEDKKEVKNSMKDFVMGGSNKVEEKSLYTSRAKRLEEGNKY